MTSTKGSKADRSTSLQRLLAIDKTYPTLAARLEEADRIRKLHHASLTTNYGREEFLLKWTIEKLRSTSDARASVTAWRLLLDIIHTCPRWISLVDVKDVLLLGLTEQFPDTAMQSSLRSLGKTPKSTRSVTLAGRKRKRDSDVVAAIEETPLDAMTDNIDGHEHDDRSHVFVVIMEIVDTLVGRSTRRSTDDMADLRYRLDGLLAFELDSCLRFVKHALIATLHVVVAGLTDRRQLNQSLIRRALTSIEDVWAAQKLTSRADPTTSTERFATECLSVASLLMTVMSKSGLDQIGRTHLNFEPDCEILQTLIDREFLRPARLLFRSQSKGKGTSSVINGVSPEIAQYLAGVRDLERIEISQQKQHTQIWSHRTLIALLDLALQRTPLATVVQRRHEQAWIDALVPAMLPREECLGDTRSTILTVKSMLSHVTASKVVLSRDVLENIIQKYTSPAKSETDTSPTAIEGLAGEILIMEPTLFTEADSAHLGILMEALCHIPGPDDDSRHNVRRDEIMVPLIQNFARARRLTPFLDLWHVSLSRAFETPAKHALWSLWTDNKVQTACVDALEASLNVQQIEEVIKNMSSTLAVLNETRKPDRQTLSKIEASIVILQATIGATTSDEVIETLQAMFRSLAETLNSNCELLVHKFDDESAASLWSLLARLYRRSWTITADLQSVRSLLESKAMQVAQKTLSRSSKHAECHVSKALDFVLQVCAIAARDAESQAAVQSMLARLWLDPKSWTDLKAVRSAQTMTTEELSGQSKSLSQRHPIMLAQALLRTNDLWGFCTSGFISILAASLRSAETEDTLAVHYDTRHMTERLISTWSEQNGAREGAGLLRRDQSARSQSYHDSQDLSTASPEQVERFLAHELGRRVSGSLTESELGSMWKLADRLDALFPGSRHDWKDDRTCFDLFTARCREVLSKRKGDSAAQSNLIAFYCHHETYLIKRKQLEGASFRLRLWILVQQAAGLFGEELLENIRPVVQRDFDKSGAQASDLEACPHEIALLRVEALLSLALWPIEDEENPIHDFHSQDALLGQIYSFASQCRNDTPRTSTLYRLDQDTICRMLERHISATPHDLFKSCANLLSKDLGPRIMAGVEDTIIELVRKQSSDNLIKRIQTKLADSWQAHDYHMLRLVLGPLKKSSFLDSDEATMHGILPTLLANWSTCSDLAPIQLLTCIDLILREKPFLVTQSSIESLLLNIHRTTSPSSSSRQPITSPLSPSVSISATNRTRTKPQTSSPTTPPSETYKSLCNQLCSLLQFHRKSLNGRAHLLMPVLIQLLACLFVPHDEADDNRVLRRPNWLIRHRLTTADATVYSRVLSLLCDPPNSTVAAAAATTTGGGGKNVTATATATREGRAGLIDQTKRARTYISQHIHSVVFAFCRFQLHGRLVEGRGTDGSGVKEALLVPGFAAVMEVLDMDGSGRRGAERDVRVRALGASMNKSELALLRREWDAWKVHGAWKG